MTAPRRTLLLVAASSLAFPACLFVGATSTPLIPPETRDHLAAESGKAAETARKTDYHIFPSRPGESILTKTPGRETTIQKPNEKREDAGSGVRVAADPGPTVPAPSPPATESPLLAIVRSYSEGRPDRTIELLKSFDGSNQEFVLAVLPILARMTAADGASDPASVAMLTEQLRTTIARLEPRAALKVENVTLCAKVMGFGRYEPWPATQTFRPNDLAQLYLEVRNLVSHPIAGPHGETYLTHVRAVAEVKDAREMLVPQQDVEDPRRRVPTVRFERKVFGRAPVNDFHIMYAFAVPATPGVYTVTLEIRDATGRRITRTTPVEFRVAGP